MGVGWLKQLVPQTARPKLRRAWTRFRHRGSDFYCPICASSLRDFTPWGSEQQFRCPVCTSKPPHRLAFQYFQSHPENFVAGETLVHVAPEPELGLWLKRRAEQVSMKYHSGGITGVGEEYLDLRQLPFADDTIQFLYCCHVLNMVPEDRLAMAEVYRVMKPNGVALLQVPAFYPGEATLEPPTEQERITAFNDPLMFRCYTDADYVSRLREAGFHVEHFRAVDLPGELVQRMQLKREVLHVCRKTPPR